jgi:hypothetical protein
VKSSLLFNDLLNDLKLDEWSSVNQYYLKLCPSQTKEMVQVGVLCFSNLFMHCEELKNAIMAIHPGPQKAYKIHPYLVSMRVISLLVPKRQQNAICVIRKVETRQDDNIFQNVV